MAQVSATQLLTGGSAAAGTTFVTDTITYEAQKPIIVAVGCDNGGGAAPVSQISGLGLSWQFIGMQTPDTNSRRISLWWATPATAGSGQLTITHGASAGDGTNWSITQFTNTPTTTPYVTTNVAGSGHDSATDLIITMKSFQTSNNATFGVVFKNTTDNINPGINPNYTELGESDVPGGRSIEAEFLNHEDDFPKWTWSNGAACCGIGLEMIASTSSPSASISPSTSISPSSSASMSPSASTSPSSSTSLSPSASLSPSSSISSSPSSSPSSSISPSPSLGYSDYTRGSYANLPTDDSDLSIPYTVAEMNAVKRDDDILVDQSGQLQYMVHQFKTFVGAETTCELEFEAESSLPTSQSTAYLQIYNYQTNRWETLASNSTYRNDVTFELHARIIDLTNYKNHGDVIAVRAYQQAI